MTASDTISLPAGSKILAADMDPLEALTGALTSHSSISWSSDGTAPSLGNGTLTAEYFQAGKLVWWTGRLTIGSTSTMGTGSWLFSVPVTAVPVTAVSGGGYTGTAMLWDAGTATNRQPGVSYLASTTQMAIQVAGGVGASIPFTWASGDILRWSLLYQAA